MFTASFIIPGLLIILGFSAYFGTHKNSATALIPAFFGLAFYVLYVLNMLIKAPKFFHAAASILAVVGILGCWKGLSKAIFFIFGTPIEKPVAVIAQLIMVGLCFVYLVMTRR